MVSQANVMFRTRWCLSTTVEPISRQKIEPHMHHVEFQFVDDDHLIADWTMHVEGKPGGSAHLDVKRQ